MPVFIRDAVVARGMMDAFHARPPYQQNDYLGCITGAKLRATQQKRLAHMLDELARGDVSMKMACRPKRTGHSSCVRGC